MLAFIIGIKLLQKSQPLLSIHENNPVLQPLIGGFMSGVLDRLGELSSAIASDDLAATKRVAHQFKGSASTYGFPQLANRLG